MTSHNRTAGLFVDILARLWDGNHHAKDAPMLSASTRSG